MGHKANECRVGINEIEGDWGEDGGEEGKEECAVEIGGVWDLWIDGANPSGFILILKVLVFQLTHPTRQRVLQVQHYLPTDKEQEQHLILN